MDARSVYIEAMQKSPETHAAVAARAAGAPLLVAVSGGLDSMVLLHALARTVPEQIAAVATFDHASGPVAAAAVEHVRAVAESLGLAFVTGRAGGALDIREGWEAAWREARFSFLNNEAAARNARIVVAHTEDDQVETVLMRIMRGSGARGMAGLYAQSNVLRPFLSLRRATLEQYARQTGTSWIDDPSNQSRNYLRNRVRLDLLPALRRTHPDIDRELLDLAHRASLLRDDLDSFIDDRLQVTAADAGLLEVGAGELAGLSSNSLMTVWGALAARAGLSLDRRGTRRIAEFTIKQPRAGWIPLAGGWQLEAQRGWYRLYRSSQASGCTPQGRGNRSVRQTGTSLSL
jgi:tRNA(Ile)-lysidine synthase